MKATVAQIMAVTPTPTPIPAFAPVLKPDEEGAGLRVCFVPVEVAGACTTDGDDVEVLAAFFATELVCAACTLTDAVAEEPGIV